MNQGIVPQLHWFFSEQGQRVSETGGLSFGDCATVGTFPGINDALFNGGISGPRFELMHRPTPRAAVQELCRSVVSVGALVQLTSDQALAGSLTVWITDNPLETREHQATVDFLENAAGAQRKQELDKANQAPRPKL